MFGKGKQQDNKKDETSLLLTSVSNSEAIVDVDGDVENDKERMSQMTERLVDNINSRISSVTLSKANATTRIFQVCMLLQSPIMFVLVSLLSFGGGGKPVLLILIASSVWLVVAASMVISVTYFDASNRVQERSTAVHILVYGWSFISVLQLSAWSLVPMLGILLCYIPVQLYIFGYRGYTIAYLKDCYGKEKSASNAVKQRYTGGHFVLHIYGFSFSQCACHFTTQKCTVYTCLC